MHRVDGRRYGIRPLPAVFLHALSALQRREGHALDELALWDEEEKDHGESQGARALPGQTRRLYRIPALCVLVMRIRLRVNGDYLS